MAIKNAMQFLKEVRFELSKVEWPSVQEFVGSTLVVLVIVALFVVYLGVIDLGFAQLAKYVFRAYGGHSS